MEGSDDECKRNADIIVDLMRAHAERHASGYYGQEGNTSSTQSDYDMGKIINLINTASPGPGFAKRLYYRLSVYLHPDYNAFRLTEANKDFQEIVEAKTYLFEHCPDRGGLLKQYIINNLTAIPGEIAKKNATRDESPQNVAQEPPHPISEKKMGEGLLGKRDDRDATDESGKLPKKNIERDLDITSPGFYANQMESINNIINDNLKFAKGSQGKIEEFIDEYDKITKTKLTGSAYIFDSASIFEEAANKFRTNNRGLTIGQKQDSVLDSDIGILRNDEIRDNYEIIGVYEGLKEISVGQVKHINEGFDKSRHERDFLIVSDVPKNPQSTSKRKPYRSSVKSAAFDRLQLRNLHQGGPPRLGGSKTKRNRKQKRNKTKTKRNRNKSKRKRKRSRYTRR